jgi:branched-chain amino acid transport system ATP-binding protein
MSSNHKSINPFSCRENLGGQSRFPSAGLSPVRQDETFIRTRRINKAGVSVIMVEQNARRCLQIADRGYVLDQGRDAYTGTGRELADDPKVIELYLGTLAKDVDAK